MIWRTRACRVRADLVLLVETPSFHDLSRLPAEAERHLGEPQCRGLGLGACQEVIHDVGEVAALSDDRLDHVLALRLVYLGVAQQVGVPEQGGERGPELV